MKFWHTKQVMPGFLPDDSPYLDVTVVVPGEPVSKARARFTKYGSTIRAWTPEQTKAGERAVAASFRAAAGRWQVDARHEFAVEVTFYAGTRQRRDIDNMCKLLLDGLNRIAWEDDRQVTQLTSRIVHQAAEPRTEFRITSFEPQARFQRPCARCQKGFDTYPSSRQRYCSHECSGIARSTKETRECKECGNPFVTTKSKAQAYCSTACGAVHRRIGARVTLTCPTCGQGYEVFPSQQHKRRYCSNACRIGPRTPPGRGPVQRKPDTLATLPRQG